MSLLHDQLSILFLNESFAETFPLFNCAQTTTNQLITNPLFVVPFYRNKGYISNPEHTGL